MKKITEQQVSSIFRRSLSSENDNSSFCLYIDFPFCRSKCEYCIYNSLPYHQFQDQQKEYAHAVFSQLEFFSDILDLRAIDSVYFGGGTPSLWEDDDLLEIIRRIPDYSSVKMIKSEMHPSDLTDERIRFFSEQVKIKVASLGVQSFDPDACDGQKRIWVSHDRLRHIVDAFHEYGVLVNIDLVALFNGDTEKDWEIFESDLALACSQVKPDVITSIPNYRTGLVYLEQIPRFRHILARYAGEEYIAPAAYILSQDPDDIRKYGRNDHWLGTVEFWDYNRTHFRYSCSNPNAFIPNRQTTLAIGGAGRHLVYSYTIGSDIIYSAYNFETHEFEYYLKQ